MRQHEEQTEEEDARAVTDVAEHDAVQEREGRRREEGRVGLFVAGHAVRVDEFLSRHVAHHVVILYISYIYMYYLFAIPYVRTYARDDAVQLKIKGGKGKEGIMGGGSVDSFKCVRVSNGA